MQLHGIAKVLNRSVSFLTVLLALVPFHVAVAQSVEDRQAAADAYDQGSRAYMTEDFVAAARWFEMANDLAPAPAALLLAIRSHAQAGNRLRSGNLALRFQSQFGDVAADVADEVDNAVAAASAEFLRVEVDCEACVVDVDGTIAAHTQFFVVPGSAHVVQANWPGGRPSEPQRVLGSRGRSLSLHFEPMAAPLEDEPSAPLLEEENGTHPAIFGVAAGLAVATLAAAIWSAVDTTQGVDEYERIAALERAAYEMGTPYDPANPYPDSSFLLNQGRERELRTNVLFGIGAGLAVTTIVLAFTTDFDGDSAPEVAVSSDGVLARYRGRF